MRYTTTVNDEQYEIEIKGDGRVFVNGEERVVDFKSMGEHAIFSLIIDHESFEAVVELREGKYHVLILGDLYEIDVTDERAMRLASQAGAVSEPTGDVAIRSPMPGLIVAVPVSEGQAVKKGQTVVILESMKMENELKAPRDGVVKHVHCEKGQSVEQNKPLIIIG